MNICVTSFMRNLLSLWVVLFLAITGCQGQSPVPADTVHALTHRRLTDSAKIAAMRGDTDRALQLHNQALDHARRHRLPEHQARSLVHIAGLLKQKDTEQSLVYLDHALRIAEALGKPGLKAEILLAKSAIYKQQQNYRAALAALEAHQKLLASVFVKSEAAEAGRLKAEKYQAILISLGIALALLAAIYAYYYRGTKRLNQALQQSNQVRDTLFSIIGHDLRGPAGSIMQSLELLDTEALDPAEQKELISLLSQQSRSFNATLSNLLEWAAAQLKALQPHIESIDALSTIRRTLDLLLVQARAKDININPPEMDSLPVLADPDQLDFVLRNLLSNAIKFSYPGGQIDIQAKREADHGVISVRDHGVGIPPALQQQLLAEEQLTSTYGTKGEKGTGLGLMLSLKFIRANHGRIWFDSREGAGTTFYISLPLALAQAVAQ